MTVHPCVILPTTEKLTRYERGSNLSKWGKVYSSFRLFRHSSRILPGSQSDNNLIPQTPKRARALAVVTSASCSQVSPLRLAIC